MTEPHPSHTQFRMKLPRRNGERAVTELLAARGHRWVIVEDGRVDSLCVDPPSESPGSWWQDCEMAAVEQILREHGGYVGGALEGAGGDPERRFLRDGRVATLELDAATALRRRQAAVTAFPTRQPEPPQAPPFDGEPQWQRSPFGHLVGDVSRTVYGDPDAAHRMAGLDGPGAVTAVDFLGALHDAVLHQGTCYADTVAAVPLLAALATCDDVCGAGREYALELLFTGAVSGWCAVVQAADLLVAHGDGFAEYEAARLTREAVQAHTPALFERWDREPGRIRMTLAALAAVTGQQPAGLAEFAQRWPGTKRATVLRLALAAARGDEAAMLTQIAQIQAWHWQGPLAGGSPLAPTHARALSLLNDPEVRHEPGAV